MRAHLLCGLALLVSHSALQAKELTVDSKQQGHGFIYGYGISNDDDNAERDTGVGIDAGFQFTPNFALYGGYQHYATQSQQGSQDDGVHGALVGGTFNVFPHFDLFSQASWFSDVQFDFAAGADIFYPLSQGWQIRGRIGAKVEGARSLP
ncbi:hypothetical protein BM525_19940 (plasmid) [Alteromonas mediterranea]|uniref:Outer membrane protein beta-barrel domain-containing protein n=1 Tax=Alteromonas mediterranea TaxID=314275 RepID=A0AAC9JEA7_9ALTE|nr:hypothetical protein [Alteromonas mediterranea]APD92155.1 hypothetical protein BM524_19745 [Alteromonas mediterranea]APE00010.1 hypothetical protein BM525_19940 [Alteromonas mediterranea]